MTFTAQTTAWSSIPVGEHLALFAPMIALTCTLLAIVACPIVLGRGARIAGAVASVGVLVTFVLAVRLMSKVVDGGLSGLSTDPAAGLLVVDGLSVLFQVILVAFLGGVTWLWWLGPGESEPNAPEFLVMLLGSALGMALMVSTANLLMIVIAIEVASLPSYAIVGFDKRDRLGAEASLKYMIFGALCAAIMLYGASLLYGLVGSLSVADLADYTVANLAVGQNRLLLAVGLFCLTAGIAFKVSAVPFHFWCPDAFQGARIVVTTWLSVASKAAGLVLLARLVAAFCAAVEVPILISRIQPMAWAIGIMAAVTCTVGNFSAYRQQSVKRLLAYSSIAHAGYMMMAAAVFIQVDVQGHRAGLTALLAYIIIYLFMNLGAFGITALVVWDCGSDDLQAFSGLMRRAPLLAIPMIICLMSLVGLPPFAGFIGKWWVLVALGKVGGVLGWSLILVAAINTLLSLYYYMRIVVLMTLHDDGQARVRSPVGGLTLVNMCALALLLLFLFAHPLKTFTDRHARVFTGRSVTMSNPTRLDDLYGERTAAGAEPSSRRFNAGVSSHPQTPGVAAARELAGAY
ncbi:MAG: NADH-quinone oxidoreductase subunit N [Phycisphaerae bacterium]